MRIKKNIPLFEKQKKKALFVLLQKMGIPHDGTLADIVAKTQRTWHKGGWLREANKERWECSDPWSDAHEQFFTFFKQLGMITKRQPAQKRFDYILILGSAIDSMRIALAQAIQLHRFGTDCDSFILLVGDRPLDKELESAEQLTNPDNPQLPFAHRISDKPLPTNETEAAKMICEQIQLKKLIGKEPIFISVPLKLDSKRPTTEDTVYEFLKRFPEIMNKPNTILAISEQPYISYLESVLKTILPPTCSLSMAGEKSREESTGIMLDTLARWLYQEKQRLEKKN